MSLDDIKPEGLELELDIAPAQLAALVTAEEGGAPDISSSLNGRLNIKRNGSRLLIKGGFQVKAMVGCDRCLADTEALVQAEVDEAVYLEGLPSGGDAEAAGDEGEALRVVDGRVDLSGLMAEFFWMAWPYHFVCRPECAGLCPRCGADLNEGSCSCEGTFH